MKNKTNGRDSEFNNRVDALFSSLETAAVDLKPQGRCKRPLEEEEEEDVEGAEGGGSRIQQEDKNGSEFIKPQGVPFRGRGRRSFGPRNSAPDYVKNPQNWTRYSMKNTRVLGDRENKLVGLELFDELRSRKMQKNEDTSDVDDKECHHIEFKKPTKALDMDTNNDDCKTDNDAADAIFGGSRKIKMQEYEVGKSKPKIKKPGSSKPTGNSTDITEDKVDKTKPHEIKLGHLMYEEEDDE